MISTISKITWPSPGFANTLTFGYLADNPISDSVPSKGSTKVLYVSGEEDAWTQATMERLFVDLRWIPTADTSAPVATGWDGATGVKAFLESARDANQFRWYPDASSGTFILSRLAGPIDQAPTLEADGTRRIRLEIFNVGGTAYTGI